MKKFVSRIINSPVTSIFGGILILLGVYRIYIGSEVTESLAIIAAGSGLLLSKDG